MTEVVKLSPQGNATPPPPAPGKTPATAAAPAAPPAAKPKADAVKHRSDYGKPHSKPASKQEPPAEAKKEKPKKDNSGTAAVIFVAIALTGVAVYFLAKQLHLIKPAAQDDGIQYQQEEQ